MSFLRRLRDYLVSVVLSTYAKQPLIFTSRGNLPLSDLTHEVEWRVTDQQTIFIERYLLNGEVVKQSAHVCIHQGAEALGAVST